MRALSRKFTIYITLYAPVRPVVTMPTTLEMGKRLVTLVSSRSLSCSAAQVHRKTMARPLENCDLRLQYTVKCSVQEIAVSKIYTCSV